LYSVALASQRTPASRRSISEVADGINYAVPTQKELDGSLRILKDRGLVQMQGRSFFLSPAGQQTVLAASAGNSTASSVWRALTEALSQ